MDLCWLGVNRAPPHTHTRSDPGEENKNELSTWSMEVGSWVLLLCMTFNKEVKWGHGPRGLFPRLQNVVSLRWMLHSSQIQELHHSVFLAPTLTSTKFFSAMIESLHYTMEMLLRLSCKWMPNIIQQPPPTSLSHTLFHQLCFPTRTLLFNRRMIFLQ